MVTYCFIRHYDAGMGKTKLVQEIKRNLEQMQLDRDILGLPEFHVCTGFADIANKNTKLHPWRKTFQELFAIDRLR
jgi:hypothetical protein